MTIVMMGRRSGTATKFVEKKTNHAKLHIYDEDKVIFLIAGTA